MTEYEPSGSYTTTWLFPELKYILGYVEDDNQLAPKIPDTATNQFQIERNPAFEISREPEFQKKPAVEYNTTSQNPIVENIVIVSLVIAALITPIMLWFSIPYPEPQIEDFFSDQHTAAIRMKIDLESDSQLFSLVEDIVRKATENGPEAISSEGLFGKLYDDIENDAPFYANFVISSCDKRDEVVFHAIYPESRNKLAQLSWDLATVNMESSSLTNIGSAKMANLESMPTGEESAVGATWFKGNYIVGHLGTSMEETIETISAEEINNNSGTSYLIQKWPYGSESPLVAVVENKNNCLSRYATTLLKHLDYTCKNIEPVKETINSNDPKNTKDLISKVREQDIHDYVSSISSSLNAIQGMSIEAYYNKNNNVEIPISFELKENSDIEGIQQDINELLAKISDTTKGKIRLWEEVLTERKYVATIELKSNQDHNQEAPTALVHKQTSGGLTVSSRKTTSFALSSGVSSIKNTYKTRKRTKPGLAQYATSIKSTKKKRSYRKYYKKRRSSSSSSVRKMYSSGSSRKSSGKKTNKQSTSSYKKTNRNTNTYSTNTSRTTYRRG